jgi:hypothetical protein
MVQKNINEIYKQLQDFGLSQLDASLVADCINMQKECSWQNNDPITPEVIEKANKYLKENNLGIYIILTPSRFDKFIWETKKLR